MKKSSILIIIILVIIITITILVDYIIKSKKKIYIINNIDLQNENIKNDITNDITNNITNDIINNISDNIKNNIVISLTTIPTRFITDEFDINIQNLSNQKLKAKYIIINICKKYNRKFEYDEKIYEEKLKTYESKFDNVKINICDDYGPATKMLGLEKVNLNPYDIVIILDDDINYEKSLTTYYALGYELYNKIDGISIKTLSILETSIDSLHDLFNKNNSYINNNLNNIFKNKYNEIYYNNYKDDLCGCVSFSFKYSEIKKIIILSKELLEKDKILWKHDDALFTYCYKKLNLSLIGMRICYHKYSLLTFKNSLFFNNIINNNIEKI